MSTLVFVLFWVVAALALLFVALRGGPKRGGDEGTGPSRRARKLAYAGFGAAVLVLGIAVPGLVIAAISDHDSIPEAGIEELTEQEERGRRLFAESCNMCHTLAAAGGSAVVGPNLDELRPPKALVLDAIENGRARGNGAMAPDLVVGEDAEAVAEFVAKAVGQTGGE